MKKIAFLFLMAIVAVTTFTLVSCKDDEVANKLDGAWQGTTGCGYELDGHYYAAEWTIIEFDQDVLVARNGDGFWVDYYSEGPYDYYASDISWEVRDGGKTIYIQTKQEGGEYTITDFSLSKDYFSGSIYIGSNEPSTFTMRKSHEDLSNYKNHQGWH